jgi:hypothetical protein
MDPITFFGFVVSACNIASFLISSGLRATATNVQEFFAEVPTKFHDDLVSDDGLELINLLVIDQDLLDDLIDDLRNSETEYRKCLRKGKTPQQRDACDRRAERRICETLNRIQDKNKDQLPTDCLRGRWTSYQCVRY